MVVFGLQTDFDPPPVKVSDITLPHGPRIEISGDFVFRGPTLLQHTSSSNFESNMTSKARCVPWKCELERGVASETFSGGGGWSGGI